jgi:hypothetical protein
MENNLAEFTLFPKLPIELRFKIWEESIPESRVVEVHVSEFKFKSKASCTFASTTPVPIILHVNHESRQLGFKRYTLHFGCDEDIVFGGLPTIYIDVKNDVVVFRKNDNNSGSGVPTNLGFLEYLARSKKQEHQTLQCLKRVAVFRPWGVSYIQNTARSLDVLPNLSEVILVTKEYHRLGEKRELIAPSEGNASCFYGKKLHLQTAVRHPPNWVADAKEMEELFKHRSDKHPEKHRPKPVVTLKLLINTLKIRPRNLA